MEINPLEIVHVLMDSLQFCLTLFDLEQELLLFFNNRL